MNLVDSSGWIEYLSAGKNAGAFSKPIEDTKRLIVPTVCIYEVFKKLILSFSEDKALLAVAGMYEGKIVNIDQQVALWAAKLSIEHKLPMADSIILAISQMTKSEIWTQDADFKGIDRVHYFGK